MLRLLLLTISVFITACAQNVPLIPPNYAGELANVNDTIRRVGTGKAEIFYLASVNGQQVSNAMTATSSYSYGRGMVIQTAGAARDVPAETLELELVGQTYHSASIGFMLDSGNNYHVEGKIKFNPEANANYLVKGTLGKDYSAVWLEDIYGNIVSNVVELKNEITQVSAQPDSSIEENIISPENKIGLFANISGGERRALVIEKLGEPDSIEKRPASAFSRSLSYDVYKYNDIGDVQFNKYMKEYFVSKITPSINASGESSIPLETQLSTDDALTLQDIGKNYYRVANLPERKLDLFAQKTWELRNNQNSYTVDSISWFCKILGKSGNPRYREFLKALVQEEVSGKLKRYAEANLDILAKREVEQFVPKG